MSEEVEIAGKGKERKGSARDHDFAVGLNRDPADHAAARVQPDARAVERLVELEQA